MNDPSRDEHGQRTYNDIAVPVVAAHLRLEDELREENERLRAIVADLAKCDTDEYETGDCVLCYGVYEHDPACPHQRARDFMGEQESTP